MKILNIFRFIVLVSSLRSERQWKLISMSAVQAFRIMSWLSLLGTCVRYHRPGWNLLLEGIHQQAYSQDDERDAEGLAHINDHVLLKSLLRLLDELNEETHPEATDKEQTYKGSTVHLVKFLDIEPD